MAYNPAYKSLVSTYFQGEYVYNYGGDVPKYPVIQTSPNPTLMPTPTPTPTPTDPRACRTYTIASGSFSPTIFTWTNCDGTPGTQTLTFFSSTNICAKEGSVLQSGGLGTITNIGTCPLPTPTNTPTPSTTPSPICNNQFVVSGSSSAVFDNGTYSRRYVISGDSIDYGYAVRITAASGYIVKGLAPDGEKYTLWQFPNGDINSVIMAFDQSNIRQGWMAQEQTPNLLQSGTTWIGASIIISSNRVLNDGYYYPPRGAVSGGVITYPSSCPTPTPTNSSTPTPTPSMP
jgi:hypothetical protein